MGIILAILVAAGLGIWFGRRLGPALVAALVVVAAPLWLIGGAALDVLRKVAGVFKIKRPGPPG